MPTPVLKFISMLCVLLPTAFSSSVFRDVGMSTNDALHVLNEAIQMACKLRPFPTYEISLISELIPDLMGRESQAQLERLFEAASQSVPAGPQEEDYISTTSAAGSILSAMLQTNLDHAVTLFNRWPKPGSGMGPCAATSYQDFEKRLNERRLLLMTKQDAHRALAYLRDHPQTEPEYSVWAALLVEMKKQGQEAETLYIFDRALKQLQQQSWDPPPGSLMLSVAFSSFLNAVGSALPESLPVAFSAFQQKVKGALSPREAKYEIEIAKTKIPLEYSEYETLYLLLDSSSQISEKSSQLLEQLPSLKEKLAAVSGLKAALDDGYLLSCEHERGSIGMGGPNIKKERAFRAFMNEISGRFKVDPESVRKRLQEDFATAEHFHELLFIGTSSRSTDPGLSKLALQMARQVIKKKASISEKAILENDLLSALDITPGKLEPEWIDYGFSVLKHLGQREKQEPWECGYLNNQRRNRMEQILICWWALLDFGKSWSYLEKIHDDYFRLQALIGIADSYNRWQRKLPKSRG